LQNEIALASAARSPEQREACGTSHLFGDAALEIESLVAGQEDKTPRPAPRPRGSRWRAPRDPG
jgi:hypothetical protein